MFISLNLHSDLNFFRVILFSMRIAHELVQAEQLNGSSLLQRFCDRMQKYGSHHQKGESRKRQISV